MSAPRSMLLFACLIAACEGRVQPAGSTDDSAGAGRGGGTRGDGGGKAGSSVAGASGAAEVVAPPAGLRRLTAPQLRNAVRDLLGVDASGELEPDAPMSGFASVGASTLALSPTGVEQVETTIGDAVRRLLADSRLRDATLGCAPKSPQDGTCVQAIVGAIGRRAWRRPLAATERDRIVAAAIKVATSANDAYAGIEVALSALLQSPNFLYRVELGDPATPLPGTKLRAYTGWEMATRLAFLLWNTTPDDELLNAAEQGALATDGGVRAQAMRLVASPRARVGLEAFVGEYLALAEVDGVARDAMKFPQLTPALRQSIKAEPLRLFADVAIDHPSDLLDVLDSRTTFVDADLARLYGLAAPSGTGLQRTMLPDASPRRGVLGTAAVLAPHSKLTDSSPTLRGRFVREVLLCQPVPNPPAGVNNSLPPLPEGLSRKEQLAQHRKDPSCAACHAAMDPIGFGLENFDALGAYRDKEAGVVIDPSGELDGASFRDARELAARVRENDQARGCLVRNFTRYATGRAVEEAELQAAERLTPPFADAGGRFDALVGALVASPHFRAAAPPL